MEQTVAEMKTSNPIIAKKFKVTRKSINRKTLPGNMEHMTERLTAQSKPTSITTALANHYVSKLPPLEHISATPLFSPPLGARKINALGRSVPRVPSFHSKEAFHSKESNSNQGMSC